MFKYFLKRLAQMVVTLFIVSILVFVLATWRHNALMTPEVRAFSSPAMGAKVSSVKSFPASFSASS